MYWSFCLHYWLPSIGFYLLVKKFLKLFLLDEVEKAEPHNNSAMR